MGQIVRFTGHLRAEPQPTQGSYYALDEALGSVARAVRDLTRGAVHRSALQALYASVVALLAEARGRELEAAATTLCLVAKDLVSYSPAARDLAEEELESAYLQLRVEVLTATPLNWPDDPTNTEGKTHL